MAGKAARVAVEQCGKQPRYNEEQRGRSLRSRRETLLEEFHVFEFKEAARRDSDNPASGEHFRPASARERKRRLIDFIERPLSLATPAIVKPLSVLHPLTSFA